MTKTYAPWSDKQVENLQRRQNAETLHQYTCGYHGTAPLVPTNSGWVCPVDNCDYEQDWALWQDTEQAGWWQTNFIPSNLFITTVSKREQDDL